MVAIQEGKVKPVQDMLAKEGRPTKDEWRVVHYAAAYANQESPDKTFMEACHNIIVAFKKAGCNISALDDDGYTPLQLACKYGHSEMAEKLLDLGAEMDLKDRSGKTALHLASTPQIISALLQRSVDVNAKAYDFSTKLHLIAADPSETSFNMLGLLLDTRLSTEETKWVQIDVIDKKGNTPAHLAAQRLIEKIDKKTSSKFMNAKNILAALLKAGADVDLPDMKKRSLKMYAADYADIAEVLDKSREACRVCECVVQ